MKKKDEIMEVIDLGSPEPVKDETNSGENKQEIGIYHLEQTWDKCLKGYNTCLMVCFCILL